MLKKLIKRIIPDELLGMIDYYSHPEWKSAWGDGGPFNGQRIRKQIFLDICNVFHPLAVVETGTHVGMTTEFLAKTFDVPIFTGEYAERIYGFAKMRLRRYHNVSLHKGDSRCFLRKLMHSKLLPHGPVFFYLDAHWGDNLPLAEELEIIFENCGRAIVMIDDFQVPWDPGYGFDDYGNGNALTSEYIASVVNRLGLETFYPSVKSGEETGKKRGCVVLAKDTQIVALLTEIPIIREYSVR
jgi:hypothetical protein